MITTAGETPVNVSGADIAFGADGTLYLWTNGSNSGAPVGLYTLTLPPVNDAVLATYLGPPASSPTPFFTGLAIRDNGYGDLIGSQTTDDTIVQVSKTNGSILASYPMKVNGAAYPYGFGDMTVGPLVFCTKTIGYWKNHSWDGRTISILGVTIDEEYGKQILRDARGNNFSMLFAQLIAAKLNVGGAPVIWDAEAFLESLEFAYPGRFVNVMGDELNYSSTFSSKSEKSAAAQHWAALDAFNNDYHCEN